MVKKEILIIGERVKQLREKAGFTQEELAKKVGLSKQRISQIEHSTDASIRKDNLQNISLFLDCTEDYLTGKTQGPDFYLSLEPNNDGTPRIVQKLIKSEGFASSVTRDMLLLDDPRSLLAAKVIKYIEKASQPELNSLKAFITASNSLHLNYLDGYGSLDSYIIGELRDKIFPEIELYIYRHIIDDPVLTNAGEIINENKDFKMHVKQILGDFQKETKANLKLKIKEIKIHLNKPQKSNPSKTTMPKYFLQTKECVSLILDMIQDQIMAALNSDPSIAIALSLDTETDLHELKKYLKIHIKDHVKYFLKTLKNFKKVSF